MRPENTRHWGREVSVSRKVSVDWPGFGSLVLHTKNNVLYCFLESNPRILFLMRVFTLNFFGSTRRYFLQFLMFIFK